ncbi:MAG: hypothetical protein GF308_06325 [Candidatus Heimdallarchaeota archaeon]|nr:hypothetical protein [Candidatus Heimdallarchaeota archaeon]
MSEKTDVNNERKISNNFLMNFFLIVVIGFVITYLVFMIRFLIRYYDSIDSSGIIGLIIFGSVLFLGIIVVIILRITKHKQIKSA